MEDSYLNRNFVKLCFERLLILMGLNFIFIICCLGIVTIASSITALNYACQQSLLDKDNIIKSYFHSFKQNFFISIPLGLIFAVLIFGASYCCYFYLAVFNGETISIVLPIFCLICIFIFLYIGCYSFSMLARVKLNIIQIIINSFILAFSKAKNSIAWIVLSSVIFIIFLSFFPYTTPIILLYGFSFPCFIKTRGILPIIDEFITKE